MPHSGGGANRCKPSRNQFDDNNLKAYKIYTCFCPVLPHLRIFPKEIIRATDKDLWAKMTNTELLTMARKTGTVNGFFPFQQRLYEARNLGYKRFGFWFTGYLIFFLKKWTIECHSQSSTLLESIIWYLGHPQQKCVFLIPQTIS